MKNIILTSVAVLSVSASAHLIDGIQVLKGSIKTKIVVKAVKTTCKVKIEKIRNLMLEDSFGNPAYNVRAEISLDGNDFERSLSVKYSKEVWLNNLFTVGAKTEVRDLEYFSADGTKMMIDGNGRIKTVSFPFESKTVTCAF